MIVSVRYLSNLLLVVVSRVCVVIKYDVEKFVNDVYFLILKLNNVLVY